MASVDIDEINKIRKAVGLPLLPSATAPQEDGPSFKEHSDSDDSDEDPASTLETREAAGYENFRQKQEEERRRIEREKRKQQVQKARDAAARIAKLEGRGLGDVGDDGDVDAKAWLKGSRKRQAKIDKERAEKLAAELTERERLEAIEYTSSDLAGVKVAHEVGDFEDGESEQILTLQDADVVRDGIMTRGTFSKMPTSLHVTSSRTNWISRRRKSTMCTMKRARRASCLNMTRRNARLSLWTVRVPPPKSVKLSASKLETS